MADTRLLLHFNGVDGATSTIDSSPSVHAVTLVGSAQLDTAVRKWGTASLLLNGTSDYATIPDSADWDLCGSNTDNWTIDLWVLHTDHTTPNTQYYITQYEDIDNRWHFHHANGYYTFRLRTGSVTTVLLQGTSNIDNDVWHHLAVCKVADEYGLYKDGVQIGYVQSSATDTYSGGLVLGNIAIGGAFYLNGQMDDVRISKDNLFGAAPVVGLTDTIQIPQVEDESEAIKLLLNFNGVNGATSTTDASKSSNVVTFVSNTQLDTAVRKWGTASVLFDGASDYITIPSSTDWNVFGSSTDNWTIDFWVKHTDHDGTEQYITQYEDVDNRWYIFHTHGTGITFSVRSGGNLFIRSTAAGEITDTDWHHMALCKVANEYALYKDGVQISYNQDSDTVDVDGPLLLGQRGGDLNWFDGNMDDVRIANANIFGAAPVVGLTDTIQIPQMEAESEVTKLLLHFNGTDGATTTTDASKSNHQITFNGNAQLDTAQKQWGVSSVLFDGSTDYLSIPNSTDWNVFGSSTDNWTIDFWVKHTDHAGVEQYITQYEDANNRWYIAHADTAGIFCRCRSGGVDVVAIPPGGEITDTDWHHIAVCKVASEYGIYKDGVQVSYVNDSSTDTFAGALLLGQHGSSTNWFDGWMDDLRIVNYNVYGASPQSDISDTITVPSAEIGTASRIFSQVIV